MQGDETPQVAIVTGGARGIGRSIAALLVERRWTTVAIDRHAPATPDEGVHYLLADVRSSSQLDLAVRDVVEQYGRIDALVTSAGILRSGPTHETSDEEWDEVIDVNLGGTFRAVRAVLPHMIAAGRGSLVLLSSVHARATVPQAGAYAASKGAVISFAQELAVEYADVGVRANSLVIGSVDTDMTTLHKKYIDEGGIAVSPPAGRIGRMAAPEEIAPMAVFLASAESSFVTGSAMRIDGGLLARLL